MKDIGIKDSIAVSDQEYKEQLLKALDNGLIGRSVGEVVGGAIGAVLAVTAFVGFTLMGQPHIGVAAAWGIFQAAAAGAALGAAIGGIIDPPQPPTLGFGNDTGSPRYGFGALSNTFTNELPVPILYGELKVAGNIVYQSEPGETIYRAVALCEGEIYDVSDVRINNILIGEDNEIEEALTPSIVQGAIGATTNWYPSHEVVSGFVLYGQNNVQISTSYWAFDYDTNILTFSSYIDWLAAVIEGGGDGFRATYIATTLSNCSYDAYFGTDDQTVDTRFSEEVYGLRHTAYLAVTLKTSDELKGGNPVITAVVKGKRVSIWDTEVSSWTTAKAYTRNPVACLRDLLTSSRYGASIPEASIDATSWGAAYEYCDESVQDIALTGHEKRCYLDYTIDNRKPVLDVVNDILSTFNGFLVFSGNKIKLKIEKAEAVAQTFSMSNIIKGSFAYSKESKDNLPNRLKVQYVDISYNYTKIFVQADDPLDQAKRRSLGLGEDIVTREVSLLGITRYSQASRQAKLFLALSRSCPTYCTFTVGPDALAAEVGDVIRISHDVAKWTDKEFRILAIGATKDDKLKLLCREYNSAIYTGYMSGEAGRNYNLATQATVSPDNPSNVVLTELGYLDDDGTWVCGANVTFTAPIEAQFVQYYVVQWREAGGSYKDWSTTTQTTFDFYPLEAGISYQVRIRAVNKDGFISSGTESNIVHVYGDITPPSNVTGFDVSQEGNMLYFTWDAISDKDLARYIIKKGGDWLDADIIAELIDTTEFMYPVGEIGKQTFMIKAIDTTGNESETPGIDTIVVIPPPERNFITEYDLFSGNVDWKLTNLSVVRHNYYNSNYARPCLALTTSTTWESREAEDLTWEAQETAGGLILDEQCQISGVYEMKESFDLGTIFEFTILIDADYQNVSDGSMTTEISISDDNSTWSSWATVSAATTYSARYVKFRITLATNNGDYNVYLYDCIIYIEAPLTVVAWGGDIPIAIAGTTILYGVTYIFIPRVTVNVVNGVVGFPVVSNKSITQFTCKVYDQDGNAIDTAEVDWESRGY